MMFAKLYVYKFANARFPFSDGFSRRRFFRSGRHPFSLEIIYSTTLVLVTATHPQRSGGDYDRQRRRR